MIDYGFSKDLAASYEQVKESVVRELQKEGFGIMTEIDVQAKLKEKLGVDFRKYVILGGLPSAQCLRGAPRRREHRPNAPVQCACLRER